MALVQFARTRAREGPKVPSLVPRKWVGAARPDWLGALFLILVATMLLAITVGNTNLSLGIFAERRICGATKIPLGEADWSEALGRSDVAPFVGHVSRICVAGVHPSFQTRCIAWSEAMFPSRPIQAISGVQVPLRNACAPASAVGVDRLLNAYAAHRSGAGDAIVVDFGTATSFSVVSGAGEFLGGAIAPGLRMSARALHQQTAALPEVAPRSIGSVTAKNTEDAINVGLRLGLTGLVDRILDGLLDERHGPARILATGGDLAWFLPLTRHALVPRPHLALEGLMYLDEQAGGSSGRGPA